MSVAIVLNLHEINCPKADQAGAIDRRFLYRRCGFWPVKGETRFVKTSYGETLIRVQGSITARPDTAGDPLRSTSFRRLSVVAPAVQTAIAAGVDHQLTIVDPDWVSDNVLAFLDAPQA